MGRHILKLTTEDLALETDEIGIWLIVNTTHGFQQVGHVSWYEITKRIQQQLLQERFLIALVDLDKGLLDDE
jgi:hypothetical protein